MNEIELKKSLERAEYFLGEVEYLRRHLHVLLKKRELRDNKFVIELQPWEVGVYEDIANGKTHFHEGGI